METKYPHQLRPKIYYVVGNGWNTDRLYDQKIENKTIKTKIRNHESINQKNSNRI